MLAAAAAHLLQPRLRALDAADHAPVDVLHETHALLRRAYREEGDDPDRLGRTPAELRDRVQGLTHPAPRWQGLEPPRWALTATRARVPWTQAHARSFHEFNKDVAAALVVGRGMRELAEAPALVAQSGWEVHEAEGAREATALAFALDEAGWWARHRMRPPLEQLRAPTVSGRVQATREALLRGRMRALAGIPSYVHAMLSVLAADPEAARVLRGVTCFVWTGMPLGPAAAELQAWLAPRVRMADVAASTEGPLGAPAEEAGVYRLAARQVVALFQGRDGELRFAHELEAGERYRVRLTSSCGLVGHDLGDDVVVVRSSPLRFRYATPSLSATVVGEVVGTPWFRLFAGPGPTLLVEGEPPSDLSALPAGTEVRVVPRGSLARAVLRLGLGGDVKVPWIVHDPALWSRLLDALAPALTRSEPGKP